MQRHGANLLHSSPSHRRAQDLAFLPPYPAALAEEDIERCEDDWFSTHPYSPLRLRAIDLFARSTTYAKLPGAPGIALD